MYDWNWRIITLYKSVFIQGALVTIWLTFLVIILGTIIGIIFSFLKRSRINFLSILAKIYIEFFRSLPILVLLIWVYYVAPILFSWRLSGFVAALIALSLNLSAFVAETVRAGIESVPKEQLESGLSLGMSYWQTMFKIILPQTIRNITPNLLGLYINILKDSSLASIIAVNEILHRSNVLISQTFRPLEIYTTVAVVYLLIIVPFTLLANYWERRLKRRVKSI